MKGIKIISTGRSIPETVVSNDDLSRIVETNDEWITTRTGIKNRHKCDGESCASLAVAAAKKAVEKAIKTQMIHKEDIGAVIVATSTPDYVFPSVACIVQKELDLPEDTVAFDISAACTGFLYGLQIAHGLINTISKKHILVVGSEQMSQIVDYTDRGTCILFGDGAGAALVSTTDTRYIQKSYSRGNIEVLNCGGVGRKDCHIHMKGNDVFKFAVTVLNQGIDEVLEEAGITMEDVDYVICHQANKRIIDHVRKKYPEYSDKFFINIEDYGNTSAASVPIAIDELVEKLADNGEKKEVKLLCVGFGAGLTWSAALVNCEI